MMNIVAIGLLLSTLAASAVWSPQHTTTTTKPPNPDQPLREGHRLIVVEYERVVATQQQPPPPPSPSAILHEAASVIFPPEAERNPKAAGEPLDVEHGITVALDRTEAKAAEIKEEVKGNATKLAEHAEEKDGEARKDVAAILRRGRDVLYDAAAYVGGYAVGGGRWGDVGKAAAAVAHMVAVATAYGTCIWVTFVSSHVLAGALPRQQFGVVQSRLYPVYFRAMAYSIGVALVGYYFGVGRRRQTPAERCQSYNLLAGLGLVLTNMFILEPKATKVMFESMKMEKEACRGGGIADIVGEPISTTMTTKTTTVTNTTPTAFPTRRTADQEALKSNMTKLHEKLKRFNSSSSLLNIITLMGLTWHLVHLSGRLTC